MNLSLPRPYPDELMYSVFARHFAYIQPRSIISAHMAIDGHRWLSTRYVRGATKLADRTRLTWGLSGPQIIDSHTLLPFNGAFLKPDLYLKCAAFFLANSPHGGATTLGMSNSSVAEPTFLRFCASCVKNDIQTYGETYWRRQHQLSGTLFCVQHDEPLIDSSALLSPISGHPSDATANCSAAARRSLRLNTNEERIARLITQRSAFILSGGLNTWLKPDTNSEYRRCGVEIGHGIGLTKLNTQKFGQDLFRHFGSSFLEKLGCRFSERSRPLRRIFYDAGTNSPLIHILAQLLFETELERSRSNLKAAAIHATSRRDWKCPNVYARHALTFRIPQITLRRTNSGAKYFHARCTCGFAFSFSESREDDPEMPRVSRASAYGEAFELEAMRLYNTKASITFVGKAMGLSHRVADRLVKRKKNRYEIDSPRISHLRADWKKTRSRATYQMLLRWDGEWIRAKKRMTKMRGRQFG